MTTSTASKTHAAHSPQQHQGGHEPTGRVQGGLLDPALLAKSLPDALRKFDPRTLWRNPVMFIVEIGALLVDNPDDPGFVVVWLAGRVLALADSSFRQPGRVCR